MEAHAPTVETVLISTVTALQEIKSPASSVAKNLLVAFRRGLGLNDVLASGGGAGGGINMDQAFGYILASSEPLPKLASQLKEVIALFQASKEGTSGRDLLSLVCVTPTATKTVKKPAVSSGFLLGKGGFLTDVATPSVEQRRDAETRRNDFRSRMVALYLHYGEPERAALVDEFLEKYQGREEEMMAILVRKYGPEPRPCASPLPPHRNDRKEEQQEGEADARGSPPPEEANWLKLNAAERARASENIQRANRDAGEQDFPGVPTCTRGGDAEAPLALTKENLAPASAEDLAEELRKESEEYDALEAAAEVAFFSASKQTTAKTTAPRDRSSGEGSAERPPSELATAAEGPFGPHKDDAHSSDATTTACEEEKSSGPQEEATTGQQQPSRAEPPPRRLVAGYRSRMVALYLHYGEPERAALVDEFLEKYQGREEEMMAILVRKYGPEPCLPDAQTPPSLETPPPPLAPSHASAAAAATPGIAVRTHVVDDFASRYELASLQPPPPPPPPPPPSSSSSSVTAAVDMEPSPLSTSQGRTPIDGTAANKKTAQNRKKREKAKAKKKKLAEERLGQQKDQNEQERGALGSKSDRGNSAGGDDGGGGGGRSGIDSEGSGCVEKVVVTTMAAVVVGLEKEPLFAPVASACARILRALKQGRQLKDYLLDSEEGAPTDNSKLCVQDEEDERGESLFEALGDEVLGSRVTVEDALEYAIRSTLPGTARKLLFVLGALRNENAEEENEQEAKGALNLNEAR